MRPRVRTSFTGRKRRVCDYREGSDSESSGDSGPDAAQYSLRQKRVNLEYCRMDEEKDSDNMSERSDSSEDSFDRIPQSHCKTRQTSLGDWRLQNLECSVKLKDFKEDLGHGITETSSQFYLVTRNVTPRGRKKVIERRKVRKYKEISSDSGQSDSTDSSEGEGSSSVLQTRRLRKVVCRRRKSVFERSNNVKYKEISSDSEQSDSTDSSEQACSSVLQTKRRSKNRLGNSSPLKKMKITRTSQDDDLHELEGICLVCSDSDVLTKHPYFIGGLCEEHTLLGQEKMFRYNMDGYASSCSVCFMGNSRVICDNLDCGKRFCKSCLSRCMAHGEYLGAARPRKWHCPFCADSDDGLLRKRLDWKEQIIRLYQSTDKEFTPFTIPPSITESKRRPIRVLSIFDGLAIGMVALQQLGIHVDKYVASEVNYDAIRLVGNRHPQVVHIENILRLTEPQLREMGPFDLLLGGCPCNDLSAANPYRRGHLGVEGAGTLFFDYYRILNAVQPYCGNGTKPDRPFFWLFENVVSLKDKERARISRFLKCEPRMVDANSDRVGNCKK